MTGMVWYQIVVTALVTVLILLVEHWGPWSKLVQARVHLVVNYISGVLAIILPLTALLAIWQQGMAIAALWIITVAGGLAVIIAYVVDGWIATRNRADVAEHDAEILRPEAGNGEGA